MLNIGMCYDRGLSRFSCKILIKLQLLYILTILINQYFPIQLKSSTILTQQKCPQKQSSQIQVNPQNRKNSQKKLKKQQYIKNIYKEMSQAFSLQAFIFVIILIIYILTSHFIQSKKVPYLHQSTIAIFMGVLTAVFAKYGLHKEIQFSNQLFFAIILPPIIFSAGYSLRKSLFFDNFGMIWFLGVIGTIIGFICITFVIAIINSYIFQALTLTQVMMISSVMCATDTIAAIGLIKPDKFPVLHAVLFGEGIINDAVAIILFRTISELRLDQAGEFTLSTVLDMTGDFTYLFFFSVAFGTISGFGLSYLFKQLESFNKHPIKEASLILLNGYFTYLMGELLGLSGIISLFTCAIIMGHFCFMNISEESQRGTGLAFQTVSYISQAFVYAYLGASILSIQGKWSAIMMALMILAAIPIVRAIMVYTLPLVYKIINKPFPMTGKELKVCWFSGMIRGVIAFAICLQIESSHKKYILTVALVIVMATTILGSTLIKSFIKWIGLEDVIIAHQQEESFSIEKVSKGEKNLYSNYRSIGGGIETVQPDTQKQTTLEGSPGTAVNYKLENFEENFMKPFNVKKLSSISSDQDPTIKNFQK